MAKKKVKITSLKKQADRVFSEYIRRKDADNDYVKCCTCGQVFHWTTVDAGHYVHRARNILRYDERNVHTQCRPCNRGGCKSVAYTVFMIKKYGKELLDELEVLEYTNKQWREWELRDIIAKYKELNKQF